MCLSLRQIAMMRVLATSWIVIVVFSDQSTRHYDPIYDGCHARPPLGGPDIEGLHHLLSIRDNPFELPNPWNDHPYPAADASV